MSNIFYFVVNCEFQGNEDDQSYMEDMKGRPYQLFISHREFNLSQNFKSYMVYIYGIYIWYIYQSASVPLHDLSLQVLYRKVFIYFIYKKT